MIRPPPNSPLFPYTTLFRSEPPLPEDVDLVFFDPDALQPEREDDVRNRLAALAPNIPWDVKNQAAVHLDRKSTRLNSSHMSISYAVFCLKKKKKKTTNL